MTLAYGAMISLGVHAGIRGDLAKPEGEALEMSFLTSLVEILFVSLLL